MGQPQYNSFCYPNFAKINKCSHSNEAMNITMYWGFKTNQVMVWLIQTSQNTIQEKSELRGHYLNLDQGKHAVYIVFMKSKC